jgi:pimeloyl-ACP methyl ester carboxylesterase
MSRPEPIREYRCRLPDGRRLGVAEYGAADGEVVLVFHGLPGSRRQMHPDTACATRLGLRLVALDRPGCGGSDPNPGRDASAVARDLVRFMDLANLERVLLAGISGGGPFALALAALAPDRVRALALISSVAPDLGADRWRDEMPMPEWRALRWARRLPVALRPVATGLGWFARHHPDRYLGHVARRLGGTDRATLARPEIAAMFRADLAAAFAQGAGGFLDDLSVIAGPWGFELSRVTERVDVWHGASDRLVPVACARALAVELPRARLHLVPEAGHFMVFDRWEEILGALKGSEGGEG